MEVPLLSIEEVEQETKQETKFENTIRDKMIEFLKGNGYIHMPTTEEEFEDETTDFFTKGEQLIQITINDSIPEEIINQMVGEDIGGDSTK